MTHPGETYRNQHCCFDCKYSQYHDDWEDLLCKKWVVFESTSASVFQRVEEYGRCDLWEPEDAN